MDNKYDDIETLQPELDDYIDDGFDDDFDGDYSEGGESNYRSGEEAFNDYQALKDEQKDIQERLENAQNEMEKDTMEIPPEGADSKENTGESVDDGSAVSDSVDDALKSGDSDKSDTDGHDDKESKTDDSDSKSDSKDEKKDDIPPEGTQSGRTPASEKPDHSNEDGLRGVVPNQDTGNGGSLPKKEDEGNQNKDKNDNNEQKKDTGDSSSSQNNKKDKNGRDVVAVKDDGTQVVKKNDRDRKNDKKELNSAKAANVANKYNKAKAVADMASDPVGAAKAIAKQKVQEQVTQVVVQVLPKILPYVLPAIGIILVVFLVVLVVGGVIVAFTSANVGSLMGYYDTPCPLITVVSENGQHNTYDLDTYTAGVVTGEVGMFSDSPETLKAFAVAARTYGLARAARNNCTIESNTNNQVFTTPSQAALTAAQETAGQILLDQDENLVSTEYDGFAVQEVTSTHYIIKQQNQQVPIGWSDYLDSNIDYYRDHQHGRGMSQWGAYYLAKAHSYTYTMLLLYYYDGYTIKNTIQNPDLQYPTTTGNGQILHGMPLSTFLQSRGSSIEQLNTTIASNVNSAGFGTRAGVVAAATTLIGEMNNYGVRLPYVWGGGHGAISNGANPNWGNNSGLDCSGFVSWALYNGGFNFRAVTSGSFSSFGNVVSLSSVTAVLQPGDLLWRPSNGSSTGHIVLVVSVDTARDKYICAEANSSSTGIIFKERDFGASGYKGIKMDSYYVDANKR